MRASSNSKELAMVSNESSRTFARLAGSKAEMIEVNFSGEMAFKRSQATISPSSSPLELVHASSLRQDPNEGVALRRWLAKDAWSAASSSGSLPSSVRMSSSFLEKCWRNKRNPWTSRISWGRRSSTSTSIRTRPRPSSRRPNEMAMRSFRSTSAMLIGKQV